MDRKNYDVYRHLILSGIDPIAAKTLVTDPNFDTDEALKQIETVNKNNDLHDAYTILKKIKGKRKQDFAELCESYGIPSKQAMNDIETFDDDVPLRYKLALLDDEFLLTTKRLAESTKLQDLALNKIKENIENNIDIPTIKYGKTNFGSDGRIVDGVKSTIGEFGYACLFGGMAISTLLVGGDLLNNVAHAQTIDHGTNNSQLTLKTLDGTLVDKLGRPLNEKIDLYQGTNKILSDSARTGVFNIKFDPVSIEHIVNNIPTIYGLGQNYPNPFNPSTVIEFSIPNYSNVNLVVFDILGGKVKTLVNDELSAGKYKVSWEGSNDNNEGVSSGIYIYMLSTKDFKQAKKMVLLDGGRSSSGNVSLSSVGNAPARMSKILDDNYRLEFYGNDITKRLVEFALTSDSMHFDVVANRLPSVKSNIPNYILKEMNENGASDSLIINLNDFFDNDDVNNYSVNKSGLVIQDSILTWKPNHSSTSLNNVVVTAKDNDDPSKPAVSNNFNVVFIPVKYISSGLIYDLDTKYSNRTAVPNGTFVAYLGSDTLNKVDVVDGHFSFKTNKSGNDSIFVVGKNPSDTSFYFWKNNRINLTGDLVAMAFNDTTGIPMMKRGWDTTSRVGVPPVPGEETDARDYLDFMQKIVNIENTFPDFPEWKQSKTGFKDNMNVKVYLNRAKAPNNWYADSSFSGLKQLENERFHMIEVPDSLSANIIMEYTNSNVGNGMPLSYLFDDRGPYLDKWFINIRGPPNGMVLSTKMTPYVVAHEAKHAIYTSGVHSVFVSDLTYIGVSSRLGNGYYDFGSRKEKITDERLFKLERNPKLLDYFK